MSLTREGVNAAMREGKKLQKRISKLANRFEPPFNNLDGKAHMNHYGQWYLFGKPISEKTSDRALIKIIEQTPEEEYDGCTGFFGEWYVGNGVFFIKKHKRLQERVDALFCTLGLKLTDKVMKDLSGKIYLFGNPIDEDMTDEELIKIINDTPEETYDGVTNEFSGDWITRDCAANVKKHKKMQKRANKIFQAIGLKFKTINDGGGFGRKAGEKVYVDGKGNLYLFGKLVTENMTDDELMKIIKETPENEYNGYTTYDGEWHVPTWDW